MQAIYDSQIRHATPRLGVTWTLTIQVI